MEHEVRRYHVVEAVGRGGFGTVYRAELVGPSGFKKQVALKVLNPDAPAAAGVAERLRDEARVLGMLRHRAIVQVDGLHLLGGRWTVVMEFVEGVDLKQLLSAQGTVPPGIALEIVQEVANALHYAYEMSVDRSTVGVPAGSLRLLHRDIKPGNIQLTAAGEVKVLDFGVARADFAQREARTQSIYFGSLNYMSPERLDGIDDHKGDIYALGALLYELVMGEPFGKTSASRERHDARLREALGKLWARWPEEGLYRTIAECLLYDPDGRPSARELERACRNLRPQFGAPWLTEWAEEVVPSLLAARDPIEDDLSGATLVEQGGVSGGVTSQDITPAPRRPARRVPVLALAAATSALVVLVGGGLAVATFVWPRLVERSAVVELDAPGAGGEQALEQLGEALASEEPPGGPAAPASAVEAQPAPPASTDGASTDGAPGTAAPDAVAPDAVALDPWQAPPAADPTAAPADPSDPWQVQDPPDTRAAAGTARSSAPAPATRQASATSTASTTSAASTSSAASTTSAGTTTAPASATPTAPAAATPTAPAAEVASSSTGFVRLVQAPAGTRVALVGAAGTFDAGRVPAGDYVVRASFADGSTADNKLTVRPDATVRLSCTAGLGCVGF